MLDSFLNSPLLYSLALTLLHFIWQGCLVALVLKCALSTTSHHKADTRYLLSSLAMLAHFLLPLCTFLLIYLPNSLSSLNPLEFLATEQSKLGLSQNISQAWSANIIEYAAYISLSWLTVVMVLVVKLLLELYSVHRLPKQNVLPTSRALIERFQHLSQQLNIKSEPQLLISLKVKVPMAIGWLKPVVLLPASMLSGLTPAQLDMLMLHELAHIRRHDYLVNFLQTLVETLLFFHPAVHWVGKKIRNEREYCSDDIAVHHCGNPVAYAHTLADTASHCNKHRAHTIPAIAMAASGGDLKQRVLRLVDHHHCIAENHLSKWLTSAIILLSVVIVTLNQFVSFARIDFNSGPFSFSPTYSTAVPTEGRAVQPLTETSITQSLLIQDNEAPLLEVSPTVNMIDKREINDVAASASVSNKVVFEEHSALSMVPEHINDQTTSVAEVASFNVDIEQPSLLEETMLSNENKSAVELAFERADAINDVSTANSYTQQIAHLAEPLVQEVVNKPLANEAEIKSPVNNIHDESGITEVIATEPQEVLVVQPVLTKAKLLKSVDPKYPSLAKRRRIELDVLVNFTIGRDGRVKDLSFERKDKSNYFKSTIRNAMAKWRFVPAIENDQVIESKMSKIFSFSLIR